MPGLFLMWRAVVKNPDYLVSHRFRVVALTGRGAKRKVIDYLNQNEIRFSDIDIRQMPDERNVIA